MEKVAIDDVEIEVNPLQVHDVRRPVTKALDADHVAMNYFELAHGIPFPAGSSLTTIRKSYSTSSPVPPNSRSGATGRSSRSTPVR